MRNTNDPALRSWVAIPEGSDFPIQNLPYGIFSREGGSPVAGVAIGEHVLDLAALSRLGYFDMDTEGLFDQPALNTFIAKGKAFHKGIRDRVSELLDAEEAALRDNTQHHVEVLHPMSAVTLHLPVKVGDYTDFYSSIEHATNVGTMFRGPENALMPNWKHLPVGYHGRSSSIVVSGTSIRRPQGQSKPKDADSPVFGPSKLLDFELEMAFVCACPTNMGDSVPVGQAEDYIFGMMLFNDWSARDIQGWEYVPLGPFLGKNFASTVSPWIVTLEALEPFRVERPVQDPEPLPYLQAPDDRAFDIQLEALIENDAFPAHRVCLSNHKYLYWTISQQLAHHTVNGCNINPGDLCASGTISGPVPESFGSMLELSWRGSKPLSMPDGTERKFIQDGDTVILRGWCEKEGLRIGFGEARGKVLPQ